MSIFNILLSKPGVRDLDTFAREFFVATGAPAYVQRESVHYVEERYFKGEAHGIIFKAMVCDATEHPDRPFCVSIHVPAGNAAPFDVGQFARSTLRAAGFEVAEVINFGRVDERRADY